MRRKEILFYALGGLVGVIMGLTESARTAGQITLLAEVAIDLVPIALVSFLVLRNESHKKE